MLTKNSAYSFPSVCTIKIEVYYAGKGINKRRHNQIYIAEMQGEYQHIERNLSHSVKLNTIYIKQP